MSFATTNDVAARLGRSLTEAEATQVAALIEDATGFLQSVIGQRVEAGTSTIRERVGWADMEVDLAEFPVRSVDAVKVNGTTLTPVTQWYWDGEDSVYALSGYTTTTLRYANMDVTYSHGLVTVPQDLKQLTCALVLQSFQQLKRTGSMDPGSLQSERVDDYSVSYQAGSASPGMSIPPALAERLRAKYGQGAYVTED